ncbi:hypothetical protein M405DRAFT_94904 [Rhizopogon salebrosus TDB-379]|nr:hypothetical protein M405DRAFT_94904 [Rhizopogon salebrosus TDB-379]
MIINIHTQNRSHKILVLSFGRSRFSRLNLGLTRLDRLVGSDVVLILHFLLFVFRNINNFIVQLGGGSMCGKTLKPEILTLKTSSRSGAKPPPSFLGTFPRSVALWNGIG